MTATDSKPATDEDVKRWWRWLCEETVKELVEEKLEELRARH